MPRRLLGTSLICLALFAARPAAADEEADAQKATEAIRKAGGTVLVDEADPTKPALRVDLGGDKIGDADLAALESLPHLQQLYLAGSHITDAGLAHLRRLTKLRKLYLSDTAITDAGLASLEDLARLEVLDLSGTKITDAGLAHLEDMPRLRVLDLSRTKVTAAGLDHLKKLDGLNELYLIGLKPKNEPGVEAKPEDDKAAAFEKKVLEFRKEQPQVKVVR